jgi:L-amino acid N-acyltransferase
MIGWATFSEWSDRPAYNATGELSIYVHHEHQRSGIGGRLMQIILDHAKEHKFHAVIGRVSETNDKSVAMHLKFGFFHVGQLRYEIRILE